MAAKQEIIDEVFEKSINKLTELSKEQFLNFVKNSILSMNLTGKQTLILNETGLKFVDDSFIDELNKAIKKRHIKRLRKGKCSIELGLVLADIVTNNCFK